MRDAAGHAREAPPAASANGVHEVLVDVLGLPLSDAELSSLTMYRMASLRGDIERAGPFKDAFKALLDLAGKAAKTPE